MGDVVVTGSNVCSVGVAVGTSVPPGVGFEVGTSVSSSEFVVGNNDGARVGAYGMLELEPDVNTTNRNIRCTYQSWALGGFVI